MYAYGDTPYLCTYEGCERGVDGNGFPRYWNLRGHMKQMHNDPGKPQVMESLQNQIDETVGVMLETVNKVSERGERLDTLDDKFDELARDAQQFRRGTKRVRKRFCWRDMKMRICLVVGIVIVLGIVVILPVVFFVIRPLPSHR